MAHHLRTARALTALISLGVISISLPPSSVISATDARAAAEAVRFRTDFGLRADPAFLALADTDPTLFPDTRWGVPLTSDEAAEIERRGKVQIAIQDAVLYASALPDFAGAYIDQQRGGLPVIQFVGTSRTRAFEVLRRAPAITIEVTDAERTHASLIALQTRIDSNWDELRREGIPIVSTGIDPETNSVVVGLEGVTPPLSEELVARFGPGLTFREDRPANADVCIIPNCWPQKGGIWVESAAVGNDCTAGFVARRDSNGEYALVTAGHCVYVGGTSTWRHNGHDIGTTTSHTWYAGSTADAAFIRMNDPGTPLPSIKNHLLRYDEGLFTVTSVGDTNVQLKGGAVCRTGYGTGQLSGGSNNGRTCGVIGETNLTHDSCINNNQTCRAIHNTWEMKFDSVGGDSGGPVFAGVLDPDYGQAYGIHVHSTDGAGAISWYSPLGWVQAEFFNHFADHPTWRFCLNTSCSSRGP